MTAIEWCRKNVFLWQASPVSGAWDESRYPFVIAPIESLDDVELKATVVYGPTQSFKTVFLQAATAYRLDFKRKSTLCCSQTDDDSREFATIKLNPCLERWGALKSTVKNGRYPITLSHWLWADHELIISGPGENAQQSKSVCYVHTDEAHRWNVEYPGALAALDDRMGLRWDRHALHVTTAADAGTEIDILWHRGRQNEWHLRCVHCDQLLQPLWKEASRETYSGHEVFRYIESQSETETLDSLEMRCPHCDKAIKDHPRTRADMDEGAQYKAANEDADKQFESFRWNAFAPRWKAWRDLLAIYLRAEHSAKLGNLEPYENWKKKQEVLTWTGEFPMLGGASGSRDYSTGDIEVVDENKLRTCSFDVQEGLKGEGGFHLWGLADEFERDGLRSKRLCYKRLNSWSEAREFQLYHKVKDKHTGCDFGAREREVFGKCAAWHWFALKSGDFEDFPHRLIDARTKAVTTILLPYSEPRLENPMAGLEQNKVIRFRTGTVPPGFCLSRLWSKPKIYPILYALMSGQSGRYYGIARDIGDEYEAQLHSYVPGLDIDKKTGSTRKVIWRQVRQADHAFICSAQSLLLAIIAGFYPLSEAQKKDVA